MLDILQKYAHLLVHYCLEIKPDEKLYISTTTLAEPLLREVYREAVKAGALVDFNMSFREQNRIFICLLKKTILLQLQLFHLVMGK